LFQQFGASVPAGQEIEKLRVQLEQFAARAGTILSDRGELDLLGSVLRHLPLGLNRLSPGLRVANCTWTREIYAALTLFRTLILFRSTISILASRAG